MSRLGYILAALNLLGGLGLVYLASVDYGRRQAWAHSYIRHETVVEGLPLNETELDGTGTLLVERLSDDDLNQIFTPSIGGSPVRTQMDEFKRVRTQLDGKIAAASTKLAQTPLLGRILLPLTDSYLEREQLLACRVHFNNEASVQVLRARCKQALTMAMQPGPANLPETPLHTAFRTAFRAQPGEPAESFVTLLLRGIPDDRAKAAAVNLDAAFDAAVEEQWKVLDQMYKAQLAEPTGESPDPNAPGKRPDTGIQKAAIARVLLGTAPFLSEEAIFTDSSRGNDKQVLEKASSLGDYQQKLVSSDTYKQMVNRTLVVCGLRASLGALTERIGGVRRLNDYVQNSMAQERLQFISDHAFILTQIRTQAELVRLEQTLINGSKERLVSAETVIKERKTEIEQLQGEYTKAKTATAEELKKLQDLTQQVLDLRLRIRDAIDANEKGESRIRDLEKQIRDLDRRAAK